MELLDLQRVAKSFGFSNPPSVSLSILMAGREGREGGRGRGREREGERMRERKGGKRRCGEEELTMKNTTTNIFVFC